MLLPVAHAYPAELSLALNTLHVIAALVLFDGLVTLGALLRVGHYPFDILTLSLRLFHPFLKGGTGAGLVGQSLTLEAEDCATCTRDVIENGATRVLAAVFTARLGTPSDLAIVVSEGLAELFPVEFLYLGQRTQDLLIVAVAELEITSVLHAPRINAVHEPLNLGREMVLSTIDTEGVSAGEAELILIRKCFITNHAHGLVVLGEAVAHIAVRVEFFVIDNSQLVLKRLLLVEPVVLHSISIPLEMFDNDEQ